MRASTIKLALRAADLVVREYVRNLEGQNAKLHKEIARLECLKMDYKNKVAALQKKLSACIKKEPLRIYVNREGAKTKVFLVDRHSKTRPLLGI